MRQVPNLDPDALRMQAPFLSNDTLAEFRAKGVDAYSTEIWEILDHESARRTAALKSGEETVSERAGASPPVGPLVTVYTPVSQTQMTMAKLILDAEGIPYVASGHAVQDLVGIGRMYTGTNLLTGPMRIEVAENHLALARDLLSYIED